MNGVRRERMSLQIRPPTQVLKLLLRHVLPRPLQLVAQPFMMSARLKACATASSAVLAPRETNVATSTRGAQRRSLMAGARVAGDGAGEADGDGDCGLFATLRSFFGPLRARRTRSNGNNQREATTLANKTFSTTYFMAHGLRMDGAWIAHSDGRSLDQ